MTTKALLCGAASGAGGRTKSASPSSSPSALRQRELTQVQAVRSWQPEHSCWWMAEVLMRCVLVCVPGGEGIGLASTVHDQPRAITACMLAGVCTAHPTISALCLGVAVDCNGPHPGGHVAHVVHCGLHMPGMSQSWHLCSNLVEVGRHRYLLGCADSEDVLTPRLCMVRLQCQQTLLVLLLHDYGMSQQATLSHPQDL